VNGSFAPGFEGVVDGGGLSNVMPSTVGETDGVMPPPVGGLVAPPPGGGLVGVPLAGHALLLGLVVGNSVLAVNGTTSRLGPAESRLGVADGMTRMVDDGSPSALAVATRSTDALPASPAVNANAAIVRNPGSLDLACVTQVTAHNPDRR